MDVDWRRLSSSFQALSSKRDHEDLGNNKIMLRPLTIFLNLVPLAIFAYLSIADALSWDGSDKVITVIVATILVIYPILNIFALLFLGGSPLNKIGLWKKIKRLASGPRGGGRH